jgi:hemerythrin superfamily protein
MTNSIIIKPEYMKICAICAKPFVEYHHCVHGTANRKLADREGLIVPLCPEHHNSSKMSVHQNKEMKTLMHQFAQASWEREYMAKQIANVDKNGLDIKTVEEWTDEAREEFRKICGQSWI